VGAPAEHAAVNAPREAGWDVAAAAAARDPAPLLDRVDSPADLRRLPRRHLAALAHELRAFLVDSVARSGGHFAAGLGTVELAIALHYTFDTPAEPIVWDVGHQAYPHKVLTGRRGRMASIRKRGGLSGFLRRDESEFDAFGAGHASTSISAALGMSIAAACAGRPVTAVAVIGDGAATAGLAYEAINHAGATDADLLVVLNDNQMSISPNVGALARHCAGLVQGATAPASAARCEASVFARLGFDCYGPVDGHDLDALVDALTNLRTLRGPRLLHIVTTKGCGYARAEADPVRYHGVTPFDPAGGIAAAPAPATPIATPVAPPPAAPTFTEVFGQWLCEAAARDDRVMAVTPAMREGSGLVQFEKRFPQRYFDVGIAEQHAVTFAAGLATQGARPVVAIYSTFLQRAFDQLVHDVALQKLPVLFAIDRAGLVGPDGATHNGSLDLTCLRCVPDLVVLTPADGDELRDMLSTGLALPGPVAVRYPRASAGTPTARPPSTVPLGRAQVRRRGTRVALLAFGTLLGEALKIADALDATVVNMRFVKPLDTNAVCSLARSHRLLVTLEENVVAGGAGSAVAECLAAHRLDVGLLQLGLPDRPIEHGTRDEALRDAGLDGGGIRRAIDERLALNQR
jgi:1-deoxy-D-xylulose-5-phosphate synthase